MRGLRDMRRNLAERIVQRLNELGFLPGEPVRVVQRGPGGREPIAVQVGDTLFALRFVEAHCVDVQPEVDHV